MKIKEILNQTRRDFLAIYECENCGDTVKSGGYDDAYFHNEVIPDMVCKNCGEKAPEQYRPLTTKYPEGYQV